MDIILAKMYNDENQLFAFEVFDTCDGGDFAEILDFFTNLKAEFGHSVVSRRPTQILFTDGTRVFLENSEIMEISNAKEFNRVKAIDGKRVSGTVDGVVLESESSSKES